MAETDEKDRLTGFLLPQDAAVEGTRNYWSMDALREGLRALACKHLLLILDCCFAGAFPQARTREVGSKAARTRVKEHYAHYIQHRAYQVITSAAHDELAVDRLAPKVASELQDNSELSPFARALTQGLDGAAGPGDGVITATDLYSYLRHSFAQPSPGTGPQQTPGLWPGDWRNRGEFIFLVGQGRPEERLPDAKVLTETTNPYQGLKPFTFEHREVFFGRESASKTLQSRVNGQTLTVVTGPSGKSSLVQAGLLPLLLEAGWKALPVLRPGAAPLWALEKGLMSPELEGSTSLSWVDAGATARRIQAWSERWPGRPLLWVVDQLEELVTSCESDEERRTFLEQLGGAIQHCGQYLRVVATVRADYAPHFLDFGRIHPWIRDKWRSAQFWVPVMNRDELRRCIEDPARERVLFFEAGGSEGKPELVQQLLDEVEQMPGALPLLSVALSDMYVASVRSNRNDRTITHADYDTLGGTGIAGALQRRAEEIFAGYEPSSEASGDEGLARGRRQVAREKLPAFQRTLRRVMLRMVSVEAGKTARRKVLRTELICGDKDEDQRVDTVLRLLEFARLVVADAPPRRAVGESPPEDLSSSQRMEGVLEPAHDTLITGWPRLQPWVNKARQALLIHRQLTVAALIWERNGKKSAFLWPKDRVLLRDFDRRARRRERLALTQDASRAELRPPNGAPAASSDRRQRGSRTLRRRWRTLSLSAQKWLSERWEEQFSEDFPLLRAEPFAFNALESEFIRASLRRSRKLRLGVATAVLAIMVILSSLSVFAWAQRQSALENARQASLKEEEAKRSAAQARDSARQAEQSAADALEKKRQADAARQLAADNAAKAQHQRDLAHGRELAALGTSKLGAFLGNDPQLGLRLMIEAGRLNPDRQDADLDALVSWHSRRTRLVFPHGSEVTAVAFSHDGLRVMTGGTDGKVRVWSTDSGKAVGDFEGGSDSVTAVAVSSDGSRMLVVGIHGSARLWAISPVRADCRLQAAFQAVKSAAFSMDGKHLLLGGKDGTVRICDTASGKECRTLKGHTAEVLAVAFNQDASRFISGSMDGKAIVWETSSGQQVTPPINHTSPVWEVLLDQSGTRALTAGGDGNVRRWDVASGAQLSPPLPGGMPPQGKMPAYLRMHVALNPQTGRVLTSGGDATAHLWIMDSGAPLAVLQGHSQEVDIVAFSPDGSRALTGSADGSVRIWDAKGQALEALIGHAMAVTSAVFSHDGRQVLTGSSDGTARLWDIPRAPLRLDGNAVTFSSDGERALTTIGSSPPRLWDTRTGKLVRYLMTGLTGSLQQAFSPDGHYLVTADASGTFLWDGRTGESLEFSEGRGCQPVAFSPDDKRLLLTSSDAPPHLVEFGSSGRHLSLNGGPGVVRQAVFNEAGDTVLAIGQNGAALVWSAESGRLLRSIEGVSWARLNSKGTALLAFSPGKGVYLGSVHGQALALLPKTADVQDAEFNRSGSRILTRGGGRGIRLWEASTVRELKAFQGANMAYFSPDGTHIFTLGSDRIVRLWDAASGQETQRLVAPSKSIQAVKFSANSLHVLTMSEQEPVRIWDVASGKLLETIKEHGELPTIGWRMEKVDFTPDGAHIFSEYAGRGPGYVLISECELCRPTQEIFARWARELTCLERRTYLQEEHTCPEVFPGD